MEKIEKIEEIAKEVGNWVFESRERAMSCGEYLHCGAFILDACLKKHGILENSEIHTRVKNALAGYF